MNDIVLEKSLKADELARQLATADAIKAEWTVATSMRPRNPQLVAHTRKSLVRALEDLIVVHHHAPSMTLLWSLFRADVVRIRASKDEKTTLKRFSARVARFFASLAVRLPKGELKGRALVAAGDMVRYSGVVDVAARVYAAAALMSVAQAHNQLGVMARPSGRARQSALAGSNMLERHYRFARAMLAVTPFEAARENLRGSAESGRKLLNKVDAEKKVEADHDLLFARCFGILFTGISVDTFEELLKRQLRAFQGILRGGRPLPVRRALSYLWMAMAAHRFAVQAVPEPRRDALLCGARRLLLGLLACAAEHIAHAKDVSNDDEESSMDACAAILSLFLDWQRLLHASDVVLENDAQAPSLQLDDGSDSDSDENAWMKHPHGNPSAIDFRFRHVLYVEPRGDMACVALWRALWNSLPVALDAAVQRLRRRGGAWPAAGRALPDDVELAGATWLAVQQAPLRFPDLDKGAREWAKADLAAARAARMVRAGVWLCRVPYSTPVALIFQTKDGSFTKTIEEGGLCESDGHVEEELDASDSDDDEIILWQPEQGFGESSTGANYGGSENAEQMYGSVFGSVFGSALGLTIGDPVNLAMPQPEPRVRREEEGAHDETSLKEFFTLPTALFD